MSEELYKVRLTFMKTGRSVYISHLDLMKTLGAAFRRAGLRLKHSEGFNPRPYISLARPLSLGYEGENELCDTVLTAPEDLNALPGGINPFLPEGITVKSAAESFDPARDIAFSVYEIRALFENGVPEGLLNGLKELFNGEITVNKRTKSGSKQTEISGMIKELGLFGETRAVVMRAVLKDGPDGSLNPAYLTEAAGESLARFKPEDIEYIRRGFLKEDGGEMR